MAGISDLLGRNGVLEQLLLWGVVNQVIGSLSGPALEQLRQDINAKHPVTAVDPATAADLAARGIITVAAGKSEAAAGGLAGDKFDGLLTLHTVRLAPADLATAVLRSYMTAAEAQEAAAPQGVDAAMLGVLVNLSGDAPGPDQLAQALRRGIVPRSGTGPGSVSFDQGIAESRLHNKWADVIADLSTAVLSPTDAASAVVRNFLSRDQGILHAAMSGVDTDLFGILVSLSGDAPGPQQLAEALRRGLIGATGTGAGSVSFQQGIAEGRLADKWAPVIQGLAQLWPTPTDALDASVKGVFDAADGKALYERLGGDPQFYDWLLFSIGDSPTPNEAAVLAARGIIPWDGTGPDAVSYAQAVKESRFRDKWANAYKQLNEHIPAPGTIVTLLSHKVLDEPAAYDLLLKNDMTADLAAAYVAEADYEAISDYRGLTQSAVIDMYVAHTISRDQAVALLSVLHVSDQAAQLMLDYADMRYVIDSINKSVQRIATLYTGRKISTQTATGALAQLDIPVSTITDLIEQWELQAQASVQTLTAAQIVDAWYYRVMTQADAQTELTNIGYTPYDAWALLSVKNKAPLPGQPPRTVATPPGAVIPGLT